MTSLVLWSELPISSGSMREASRSILMLTASVYREATVTRIAREDLVKCAKTNWNKNMFLWRIWWDIDMHFYLSQWNRLIRRIHYGSYTFSVIVQRSINTKQVYKMKNQIKTILILPRNEYPVRCGKFYNFLSGFVFLPRRSRIKNKPEHPSVFSRMCWLVIPERVR